MFRRDAGRLRRGAGGTQSTTTASSGAPLYVIQDPNGNVIGLVSTSGQVVERYVYSPYGQVTFMDGNGNAIAASAYGMSYLFQAGRYDAATGLYNFRHRDLSPTLGTWVEQDPLGFQAGNNFFSAFANNPVNGTDPTGEEDEPRIVLLQPTPRCIACHNPIIMGGGSIRQLPQNFQLSAMAWTGTTTASGGRSSAGNAHCG